MLTFSEDRAHQVTFALKLAFSPELMPFGHRSLLSTLRGSSVSTTVDMTRQDWLAEAGCLSRILRDNFDERDRKFLQAYCTIATDMHRYQEKMIASADVAAYMLGNRSVDKHEYCKFVMRWMGMSEITKPAINRMSQWRYGNELRARRDSIIGRLEMLVCDLSLTKQ